MKNKIFSFFLFDIVILAILGFTFVLSSCSCKPCQQQEESQIPVNILRKADQFIISKTGSEFFQKFITIDYVQSKHLNPNYFIVYKFYMPEKEFVDEEIRFTTDSLGNVLKQYEIVGIPDCANNANDCDFVVDETIARQIATQNDLPKGVKDWKCDFVWNGKYNKYVWEITSTINQNNNDKFYRANGEKIIIDSNNASVLSKDEWRIN